MYKLCSSFSTGLLELARKTSFKKGGLLVFFRRSENQLQFVNRILSRSPCRQTLSLTRSTCLRLYTFLSHWRVYAKHVGNCLESIVKVYCSFLHLTQHLALLQRACIRSRCTPQLRTTKVLVSCVRWKWSNFLASKLAPLTLAVAERFMLIQQYCEHCLQRADVFKSTVKSCWQQISRELYNNSPRVACLWSTRTNAKFSLPLEALLSHETVYDSAFYWILQNLNLSTLSASR